MAKSKITADEVRRWMGQPVCLVLRDGSYVMGWITDVGNGQVTVHGRKGRGRVRPNARRRSQTAKVDGLLPSLAPGGGLFGGGNPLAGGGGGLFGGGNPLAGGGGGLFGGGFPFGGGGGGLFGGGAAGGAAPAGGLGGGGGGGGLLGMIGKIGKAWPTIRTGLGMLQTIIPLLGGLKI